MRFALPGYDVDSPSTPRNKIIFDSDDFGNFALYDAGYTEIFYPTQTSLPILTNEVVASKSWSFIPFVHFMYSWATGGTEEIWTNAYPDRGMNTAAGGPSRMEISTSGIRMWGTPNFVMGPIYPIKIKWVAFKVSAV